MFTFKHTLETKVVVYFTRLTFSKIPLTVIAFKEVVYFNRSKISNILEKKNLLSNTEKIYTRKKKVVQQSTDVTTILD